MENNQIVDWLKEAITIIKSKKQRADDDKLCKLLMKKHGVSKGSVLSCLAEAINQGVIKESLNNRKKICYHLPEDSEDKMIGDETDNSHDNNCHTNNSNSTVCTNNFINDISNEKDDDFFYIIDTIDSEEKHDDDDIDNINSMKDNHVSNHADNITDEKDINIIYIVDTTNVSETVCYNAGCVDNSNSVMDVTNHETDCGTYIKDNKDHITDTNICLKNDDEEDVMTDLLDHSYCEKDNNNISNVDTGNVEQNIINNSTYPNDKDASIDNIINAITKEITNDTENIENSLINMFDNSNNVDRTISETADVIHDQNDSSIKKIVYDKKESDVIQTNDVAAKTDCSSADLSKNNDNNEIKVKESSSDIISPTCTVTEDTENLDGLSTKSIDDAVITKVLEVIHRIKKQKQSQNEVRICRLLCSSYGINQDDGLRYLNECVYEGIIIKRISNRGNTIYEKKGFKKEIDEKTETKKGYPKKRKKNNINNYTFGRNDRKSLGFNDKGSLSSDKRANVLDILYRIRKQKKCPKKEFIFRLLRSQYGINENDGLKYLNECVNEGSAIKFTTLAGNTVYYNTEEDYESFKSKNNNYINKTRKHKLNVTYTEIKEKKRKLNNNQAIQSNPRKNTNSSNISNSEKDLVLAAIFRLKYLRQACNEENICNLLRTRYGIAKDIGLNYLQIIHSKGIVNKHGSSYYTVRKKKNFMKDRSNKKKNYVIRKVNDLKTNQVISKKVKTNSAIVKVRGRPRKNHLLGEGTHNLNMNYAVRNIQKNMEINTMVKKARGRPKKNNLLGERNHNLKKNYTLRNVRNNVEANTAVKKGRGRPRKNHFLQEVADSLKKKYAIRNVRNNVEANTTVKKGRGRPRKNHYLQEVTDSLKQKYANRNISGNVKMNPAVLKIRRRPKKNHLIVKLKGRHKKNRIIRKVKDNEYKSSEESSSDESSSDESSSDTESSVMNSSTDFADNGNENYLSYQKKYQIKDFEIKLVRTPYQIFEKNVNKGSNEKTERINQTFIKQDNNNSGSDDSNKEKLETDPIKILFNLPSNSNFTKKSQPSETFDTDLNPTEDSIDNLIGSQSNNTSMIQENEEEYVAPEQHFINKLDILVGLKAPLNKKKYIEQNTSNYSFIDQSPDVKKKKVDESRDCSTTSLATSLVLASIEKLLRRKEIPYEDNIVQILLNDYNIEREKALYYLKRTVNEGLTETKVTYHMTKVVSDVDSHPG